MRQFTRCQDGASGIQHLVFYIALAVLVVAALTKGLCVSFRNVHVVSIDLKPGVKIRPVMARRSSEGGQSFLDMVKSLKPYAAINGTFYDENYRPLGDVVIGGKIVNRGHYRNAIAIKSSGQVDFLHVDSGRLPWRGYTAGLAAGPRLVHSGKVSLNPVADGFSRRSLTINALRSAVGKTKDGKLLLVTTKQPMLLAEFAKVMLDLGAVEALNLDGGGACGLYHNGKFLSQPYLPMTNILAVYK